MNSMPTREEATWLAHENADSERSIEASYWFPSEDEFRIVHVDATTLPSDGRLRPFPLADDPAEGINYPVRVAFVLPDEVHQVALPEGWGTWEQAVMVFQRPAAA